MKLRNKILGGALLVAGTEIGAGMLALPITTGLSGFFNAIMLFLGCFLFMLSTLFFLMEATLYHSSEEVNIITITKARLGRIAESVAWFSFLLILYAAGAAYITGSGSLILDLVQSGLGVHVPAYWGVLAFTMFFVFIIYAGITWVDLINRIFMLGLVLSYIILVGLISPHVKLVHLSGGNMRYLWPSIPIVILSFTSHIIVPSLRGYFGDKISSLKKALIIGNLATLFIYVVWEFLLVGVLPSTGRFSLMAISKTGEPIARLVDTLEYYLHLAGGAIDIGAFSFFALITSFLGVVLSLFDFLADGLKIDKHTQMGRIKLILLTFCPPLLFALFYPSGFVLALSYAGLFITILYAVFPVLMVWKARYIEKLESAYCVPGGKTLLVIVLLLGLGVVILQAALLLGILKIAT